MEKSFRDILSQFLEEKEQKSASAPSENAPSPENHFQVFEPTWHLDKAETPSRKGVLHYKSLGKPMAKNSEIPSETPIAMPVMPEIVEELIPLEKLDRDSRVMVGILLDLGATELKSGVSLARVKKSYRKLVKRFHPDRMSENSSPKERESAKTAFFRLQKAYDFLSESLSEDVKSAA